MGGVYVNARFSGRAVTGVERVAAEIIRNLTLDHGLIGPRWPQGPRGHLAEQVVPCLQSHVRSGLLWSPANSGPVLHPHHVVTIHDVATIRHPEYFSARFRVAYRALLGALGRTARAVVAPSRFTARELIELGLVDPGKLHVIGNGVDGLTGGARLESLAPLPFEVPGEYLLTVGSRDPRKNLGRLVAAYAQARSSKPLPTLLVVGGRGRAFVEVETCRSDGVRYLGRVEDGQLSWLYRNAKAVVNVSTYEGFGLTVAEAAQVGVPLLLSDISPHRELVADDEAVLWVDPFDQSAMTAALLRLDERSPASHQVLGHSWAQAGAAYSDLFRSLVPGGIP